MCIFLEGESMVLIRLSKKFCAPCPSPLLIKWIVNMFSDMQNPHPIIPFVVNLYFLGALADLSAHVCD